MKKSFSAFDGSTLKQIEQILSDKDRLIKRTQINRSNVKVIGAEPEEKDGGEIKLDPGTQTREPNPALFDDDDFYHQLLREVIERKSSQTTDPIALSQVWVKMQNYRTKNRKVVDRKASKGRKIRYHVHAKLVNFMASDDRTTWTDEQRDELFKSLYGHRFARLVER